jgi:[ribosomal protein S5]-alanine N-acetyltransferase
MRLPASSRWIGASVELFLLTPEAVGAAYVGWLNDPLVNRYLESRFALATRESTCAFVAKCLEDPNTLFLGIRSTALGRHVGNIKLGGIDRHHGLAEVGIMVGDRAAWGQGIATQAIERLADIAAAELRLRKLSAGCYASNSASARAFAKAGFCLEATRPAHFVLDGCPEDGLLLGKIL